MYIEFATRRYSISVGRAAEGVAMTAAGEAAGAAATAAERAATPATSAGVLYVYTSNISA